MEEVVPTVDTANSESGSTCSPSSRDAAIQRRIDRLVAWNAAARAHAEDMLSDDPMLRAAGEGWWRQTLNQPRVVLSVGDHKSPHTDGSAPGSEQETDRPHTTGDQS